MSYIPDFKPRASRGFNRLEIWLQEATLDVLEILLADPTLLNFGLMDESKVYDFKIDTGGLRHYVFITIRLDARRMVMRIMNIASHIRPLP